MASFRQREEVAALTGFSGEGREIFAGNHKAFASGMVAERGYS